MLFTINFIMNNFLVMMISFMDYNKNIITVSQPRNNQMHWSHDFWDTLYRGVQGGKFFIMQECFNIVAGQEKPHIWPLNMNTEQNIW